jgi:predicted Zn-dependent protease
MLRQILQPWLIVVLVLFLVIPVLADRTPLKPGWNLFSQEQDIEMGRQVSKEAEAQLQILNNRQATDYLNALGKRLAAKAPNSQKYPFQFKVVNDKAINAFALPGGFIYVNRGAFEAASNEAQLAGVIAHEIGHVALRHGTNQASKAYLTQAPLSILGGALGGSSALGVLAQLGIGFGANSLFLKYSRDAESQADLMGTQILYDSGYTPQAMSQFFETIEAESKGGRSVEFLSDHPNPENRIGNVNKEIQKLGAGPPNARSDSPEFQDVKQMLAGMPAPPAPKPRPAGRSFTGRKAR